MAPALGLGFGTKVSSVSAASGAWTFENGSVSSLSMASPQRKSPALRLSNQSKALLAGRCSCTRDQASSSTSIAHHTGLRALRKGSLHYPQGLVSFHEKVQNSLTARDSSGACRAQVTMMPIGTPKVPYRTPQEGGWQWVDIWNVLYRERIIFIGQYIDEEFGNQVLATMLYLDSIDNTKPMYLYLNSPGGDLTPCMALYDTLQSIKSPVGTLALGYAYNNAGLLLSAGEKGLRVAMPMTRIALQSPAGSARGQADDIQNEAKELSRVRNYVFNQVAKNCGQPLDKVTKDLSRIKRFSAQEALDYGLIDRIVRPRRIKPDAKRQQSVGVGLG